MIGLRALSDRLPPALSVAVAVGAIVVAVAASSLRSLAVLGVVPIALLVWRRARWMRLAKRLLSLAPMVLLSSLLVAASTRGGAPVHLLGLATTREAIAAGVRIGVRIVTAAMWTSWLTEVLTAAELERALLGLGVPSVFVELIALTRRFASQLRVTLTSSWTAAALRGGFAGPRTAANSIGSVAGVVLVRAIDRSERVATSLALRGHGGRIEAGQ